MGCVLSKTALRRQRLEVLYEFRVKPDLYSELEDIQGYIKRPHLPQTAKINKQIIN